ncbi:MAG: hypothetical protein Q4A66_02530 [Eubacteriales bacterium]|nr:hypothetical protein [Eubacteriales bacterium]
MNRNDNAFDFEKAAPEMPDAFLRRIHTTCETLPEKQTHVPLMKVGAAVVVCLAAVLAVFFSIGRPGGVPDMLTPLTQSISDGETDLPGEGGGEEQAAEQTEEKGHYSFNPDGAFYHCIPYCQGERNRLNGPLSVASENGRTACPVCLDAEYTDPAFVREGHTVDEMREAYALTWPFEANTYDDQGVMFEGDVYLYEYTFDPYYHVDPEKCGAGTKDDMLKTIRQMAYRRYEREICLTCAPVRDLDLMFWLNEGGRFYHKDKECCGEVMQVYTTLENAVKVYDVPSLCPYCSGLRREGDADEPTPDEIISINWSTYEITLNSEWAYREVHLAENGVYHYDALCTEGELEPMSQLMAVRDHEAAPCIECMGPYTRNLAVCFNEGDALYHAMSMCGGSQLSKKAFQYDAIGHGMTLCSECFRNY